jgi:cation:H+ antiporter
MTVFTLIFSIILVFIASLLFVNALEWLGHHLKLGSSFVGAILSPLFTSLPELIVILIAIFSQRGTAGSEIGIGTIYGEPFMASSLSYGLVGIVVLAGFLLKKRPTATMVIDRGMALPYIFIIVLFPLTLIPGFVHLAWLRYAFGVFFLLAFVLYVTLMYRKKNDELMEEPDELTFARFINKSLTLQRIAAAVQVLAAAVLLYFASKSLVGTVATIAQRINASPLGLAMIIIPVATVIPETITALIWGFRGKDTLSIGSLVGEKILYATFYPALGLFITAWALNIDAVYSVIVTTAASLLLLVFILKKRLPWYGLLLGLAFFAAYAVIVFAARI